MICYLLAFNLIQRQFANVTLFKQVNDRLHSLEFNDIVRPNYVFKDLHSLEQKPKSHKLLGRRVVATAGSIRQSLHSVVVVVVPPPLLLRLPPPQPDSALSTRTCP